MAARGKWARSADHVSWAGELLGAVPDAITKAIEEDRVRGRTILRAIATPPRLKVLPKMKAR